MVPRSSVRALNLRHRSVAIAVVGSDGRLLVHRRSAGKDVELDELAARAPFVPDSWAMVLPLLEGFGS